MESQDWMMEGLPLKVMAPHPNGLEGRTFLTNPEQCGQVKRARIVEAIDKHEAERLKDPAWVNSWSGLIAVKSKIL